MRYKVREQTRIKNVHDEVLMSNFVLVKVFEKLFASDHPKSFCSCGSLKSELPVSLGQSCLAGKNCPRWLAYPCTGAACVAAVERVFSVCSWPKPQAYSSALPSTVVLSAAS